MPRSAETILIADDEATVRSFISAILRREGFDLLAAVDGADALDLVHQRSEPIDLLLTDIRMPRMDGVTLAQNVSGIYPDLPVIYTSGYPFDFEDETTRHPRKACAFLAKPFSRSQLLDAVRRCLKDRHDGKAASNRS